jgi:hypothetical protein
MSLRKQYALLDHTAQTFLNPLVFQNDGDAIRWFTTVVNNDKEETNINKYPHQFTLYRLADFNDKTAKYEPRENEPKDNAMNPKELITGIQVQEESLQKYTVKELITMLKSELNMSQVTNIKEVNK